MLTLAPSPAGYPTPPYVGINTTAPQSTLSVSGGVAIGTTYAGTNAAGSNNLIVQGNVGIGSSSPVSSLDLSQKTDALALPSGTVSQRPGSPVNGMIRYNSTATPTVEAYVNGAWTSLSGSGGSSTIALGTSASVTNPQRSGDVTTGLFSAVVGTVSVASGGTDVADFTTLGLDINGTVTAGSDMPSLQINGNNAIWQDAAHNNLAIGDNDLPETVVQTGGGTNGEYNTTVGVGALSTNTTGYGNTAVGYNALASNDTGSANVAVGDEALYTNTGNSNTAVGQGALQFNTDGGGNTGIGSATLNWNTTGVGNTAVGEASLLENTTGSNNTAVGEEALLLNSTGSSNTGIGASAAIYNQTGNYNTVVGAGTLSNNLTGGNNTALGYRALYGGASFASNVNNNTAVGYEALYAITTGSNNTALGNAVGSATLTTGSNNILIGTSNAVDTPAAGTNNFLNIGNAIFATGMTGTVSSPVGNVGIGSTSPAYPLDVVGNNGSNWTQGALRISNSSTDTGLHLVNTGSGGRDYVLYSSNNGSGIGGGNFTIGDATASASRLAITSTGNVGIGTTSPSSTLTFANNVYAPPLASSFSQYQLLFYTSPSAATSYGIGVEDYNLGFNSNGGYKFYQNGNSTPLMVIGSQTSGNVGIGIKSPASKLVVASDQTFGSYGDSPQVSIGGSTDANKRVAIGFDTTSNFGWITADWNGSASENLVLNGNGGNVGVGTTSWDSWINLAINSATNPYLGLYVSGTRKGWFGYPNWIAGLTSFSDAGGNYITLLDNGKIAIMGGNVGIGSASPVDSLDIGSKTDAITLPVGTTVQAPSSPVNGMIRYNSTDTAIEAYVGGQWVQFMVQPPGSTANVTPSGPPVSANTYTFSSVTCNFTPSYGESCSNLDDGVWPANATNIYQSSSCLFIDGWDNTGDAVVFDLGSVKLINNVYLSIEGYSGSGEFATAGLTFSTDGVHYTNSITVYDTNTADTSYQDAYYVTAAVLPGVSARYIMLTNTVDSSYAEYTGAANFCQLAVGP